MLRLKQAFSTAAVRLVHGGLAADPHTQDSNRLGRTSCRRDISLCHPLHA
jgi:hypothetical protein